ncbi:hypothetical protein CLAM6_23490 [Cobetia sp. AM6]|nr:hypothetical protein CLAM6_23490 [Cobetia sp. AM6]
MKIWRERHNLDFPSFYLELVTINALKHSRNDSITISFFKTLSFIAEHIKNKKYVDPANTNNIISDELSNKEKSLICNQAQLSFKQQTLDRIIW